MKKPKEDVTQTENPAIDKIEFCGAKIIEVADVPLSQIIATQTPSARTALSNKDIIDLANNIDSQGQLVPGIVRFINDKFELLDAHRSKLAKAALNWDKITKKL
jgi:ParB-like chromosome segregation protein Spo0J